MEIKLKIARKNIISRITSFEFDVLGYEFLVKNFNDFDIFAGFSNDTDTSKMIKIPAKTAQICLINKGNDLKNTASTVYVASNSSAGEVEVQCVKY